MRESTVRRALAARRAGHALPVPMDELLATTFALAGSRNARYERPKSSYIRQARISQDAGDAEGSKPVEGRSDSSRTRAQVVGANIRRARERAGLSQYQLGALIDVRQHHISDYERGKHEPGAERLAQIADVLGIAEPAYFFLDSLPDPDALDDLAEESVA